MTATADTVRGSIARLHTSSGWHTLRERPTRDQRIWQPGRGSASEIRNMGVPQGDLAGIQSAQNEYRSHGSPDQALVKLCPEIMATHARCSGTPSRLLAVVTVSAASDSLVGHRMRPDK